MTFPIKLSDFEKLSFHEQYSYAHNYLVEVFKEVSVSIEHIPMDILNSIVIFVQNKPEIKEREIMNKFMTYPIHIYNFQNMNPYYKDIYSSTRVWNILLNLYFKPSDIEENLFYEVSMFVQQYPNASNNLILQKINQLQHQ